MSTFELLKSLQNPPKDKKVLPRGIKYAEHTVIVETQEVLVHVPSREAEAFISESKDKDFSLSEFNKLMRKFRGIRG